LKLKFKLKTKLCSWFLRFFSYGDTSPAVILEVGYIFKKCLGRIKPHLPTAIFLCNKLNSASYKVSFLLPLLACFICILLNQWARYYAVHPAEKIIES